jgi:integrase
MGRAGYTLDEVNARLAAKRSKVRIALRGKGALNLQATLPPKPLSKRKDRHQQYIPLGLSYPAEDTAAAKKARDGIMKRAEAEADRLDGDIVYNRFDWENYNVSGTVGGTTISEIIRQFEKHHRSQNRLEDRTWRNNYMVFFKHLPPDAPISASLLRDTIALRSQEGAGTRQTFCKRYKLLADFAGIEVDFSEFRQRGRPKNSYEPREIPSDAEILRHRPTLEGRYKQSLRGWQWVYSILFVAGLRPHEAFFCEWSSAGLEVTKGKTGPRTVLYEIMELMTPGLIERWSLKEIHLPGIDAEATYHKGTLGHNIANTLYKKKIPIKAYDIRHAFALRGISFNVPAATMAAMMGHSEDEHVRTYRKHLDTGRNKDILRKMLENRG